MNNNPYQEKVESGLLLAIKEEDILVAPESKVDIHIGIINRSANEDYVDILIKGIPPDWTTIDTPVVHLAGGEAKQIILTVQPPALLQSRVGQYPLDVRAVSQSDPKHSAVAHSSLTVAAFQSGGRIGVTLASIYFSVAPGSSVTIPVLLQNHGLKEDVFELNVDGIPANWITTNAVFTKLEPSGSKEITFTIRVPRSPEAGVGRTPFKILAISQDYPDQKAEAECILTVAAFSKFSASLRPENLQSGQSGQLSINNEGNTADAYSLSFDNPAKVLIFEKEVPVSKEESQTGTKQMEMGYVEIPQDEKIHVDAGTQGIYAFRSRLRSRPILGNEKTYPFAIKVLSTENMSVELPGEVKEKGFIPPWMAAALMIGTLVLCLLLLIPFNNAQQAARATQTASFLQTQVALPGSGQEDTDGDGLINSDEIEIGTDPLKTDTDGDELSDGEEASTYMTNPLVPDTDNDELPDGDEVQNYKTDPLNPDTDADLLQDGDEITRRTNPLIPDTDQDALSDSVELSLGTDPLQQDTDKDGLLDGQENQTCPRPLSPDSDNDGILDGSDLDSCNPSNPSLTASVPTQPSQGTAIPPTNIPTGVPPVPTNTAIVPPTNTAVIPPTNTPVVPPTSTATIPVLQGIMLFGSNRDGNPEIYATNLANQSTLRLTNNSAIDMQPAIAPDSLRVAYVSNQNGNNEIYLTGTDRRPPVNLTNNPADDQQPTWSPDGNWIAFTSNRDGNQEIYIMRSDGSNVRNLTSSIAGDFAPAWFSIPRFLGTDDWIAFTSDRDGNQEIYRVKPDGSGLTNLTKNTANDYAPSGFAEGRLIAFVTDRDGNPEIYTMTTDGDSLINRTNNLSQDLDPSFDSRGGWIAFSSDRIGNIEVYLINLADGKTYNMTRDPSQDQYPDW